MSEQRQGSIPPIDLPPGGSGRSSKGTSPTRATRRSSNAEQGAGSQSTNSNTSPTRQPSNTSHSIPSAAAVQRALSAARSSIPNGESLAESSRDKLQRPGQNTPSWPTSPRLKSPPPTSFKTIQGRRPESEMTQSNTSVRRLAPVSAPELAAAMQTQQENVKEQSTGQTNHRTSGRGASAQGTGLETVDEDSAPTTPSIGPIMNQHDMAKVQVPPLDQTSDNTNEPSAGKEVVAHESGETTSRRVPDRMETAPSSRAASASRPATSLPKRSLTNLAGKSKSVAEPLRTMTIETETVSSTPQIITDRGRDGGSVRTKASTETIRPKKDKKKPSRKTPSLSAGMNSSKADIFEAKVASAVDEADSSGSDETFVYESNPLEPRQGRHHSRTPSATSLASQIDPHGLRGKLGARNGSIAVAGKKSMKFSNSIYGNQLEPETTGDGNGSTRTASSTQRHHHIGRHGRNVHPSITDADSPFTQANRGTSPRTSNARNSRPNSPRTANNRLHLSRKSAAAGYDNYDDGADDERAPLMGSVRVRNKHGRRLNNNNHFRMMEFSEDSHSGCWPRFGSCVFLGVLITLFSIGVAIFVVALNRPLYDVEIRRIENVLASEQELMLDLRVRATNPNLFAITVNELDVNIFAESPYVGSTGEWEGHQPLRRISFADRRRKLTLGTRKIPSWFPPYRPDDGVDEGTDPIDDPELGTKKMLLGRICEFDSPLVFEPSPMRHSDSSSTGEIRLTKPGNKTEVGGSARWERVLQHPFDLIVRGVIRYQLPISSSTRTAKIGGRIAVAPGGDSNDGDDGDDDDVAATS